MAFDEADGTTILFGGGGWSGDLGDTWRWDGQHWTELHPSHSPPQRGAAALAYDPSTRHLILFGGVGPAAAPYPYFSDTWAWNGSDWVQLHPFASPSPRAGMSMATDHTLARVLLFGGQAGGYAGAGNGGSPTTYFDDTWIWSGTTWEKATPGTSPPARAYGGLAEDPANGVIVLFGGGGHDEMYDTWTWSKGTWSRSASTGPSYPGGVLASSPRGALCLDDAMGVSQTWLFDATGWHGVSTPNQPPGRATPAIAFDPTHQIVIAFGGVGRGALFDDTRLYEAVNWSQTR